MQILFATSNGHKISEVRAILAPLGMTVVGLDTLDVLPDEPVEDGDTFQANVRLKAVGYAAATGQLCLADDSGLEVDALGGAPGVISARYAGVDGARSDRDAANNRKLLDALGEVPDEQRTARFVCTMCLADGAAGVHRDAIVLAETRGTFDGVIAREPRGESGFGYDPLVYLPDRQCTVAQLSAAEKNARSHRGHAARAMAARMRELGLTGSDDGA